MARKNETEIEIFSETYSNLKFEEFYGAQVKTFHHFKPKNDSKVYSKCEQHDETLNRSWDYES